MKMIFVGYDGESTNYRVIDSNTFKITVTRDAVVNEKNDAKNNMENPEYMFLQIEDMKSETENTEPSKETDGIQEDEVDKEENSKSGTVTKQQEDSDKPQRVLRDKRLLKKPSRYENCHVACVAATVEEPQTYEEAMSSNDAKHWEDAMQEEINSLKSNETWSLVKPPKGEKILYCKWVYRLKYKSDGTADRYKARLCAKGYLQRKGIDFNETFSPVVRYDSITVLIALAAEYDMYIKQFDVKTAFLHGELSEEIFMKQPEGFITNLSLVCKLHKSLYKLKQAPRCWNTKFITFLKSFNFRQCEADKCVLRAQINKEMVYLALYVDDGLIICKRLEIINRILKELDKQFKITISDPNYFVGFEIHRNERSEGIFINQYNYINRILHKFNMKECKPVDTPALPGTALSVKDCPQSDQEKQEISEIPYREIVGSLKFLAVISRPDIMHAVNQVSRFLSNPGKKHWVAAKRILRYFKGTMDIGILYKSNGCVLRVYTDTDFANDQDNRKSISGYISILANAPITWSSKQQKCVARSTAEAEYVSASEAAQEIVWLRLLLTELLEKLQPTATQLLIDNQSAMKLMKNTEHHKLTKHIDIKYNYICECVESNVLAPVYMSSKEQLADFLTKPLSKSKFIYNRKTLDISSII